MSEYRPVEIDFTQVYENCSRDDGNQWAVTNLIERAKDLPVFDLPLCAVFSGAKCWHPIETAYDLAGHMKRAMAADMTAPVILDEEGFIMDGWHRVARALMEGRATIPAVRFSKTPPADFAKA